ncbi:MAG: DUF2619 domain-containing protein [Bacillota bacterium]
MNRTVLVMFAIRFAFGLFNLAAAAFMLRLGRIDSAVRINALIGSIGPVVFLVVSALGLLGLAAAVSPAKLALVGAGVVLMFLGTR